MGYYIQECFKGRLVKFAHLIRWQLLLLGLVCADDSFITRQEYGEMLYKNPRGVGCNHCHGPRGEGMVIARYAHKGEPKVLETQSIRNLSRAKLADVLQKNHAVMPTYFLTADEINALYTFLHDKE